MNLARLLLPLFVALAACETPVRSDRGAQPSDAASADVRQPAAPARNAAPPRDRALPTQPSGTPIGATPVRLKSGALLTLPPEAIAVAGPSGMPAEVQQSHMFRLGEATVLLVGELARPEGGCTAALDQEWAKLERAKGDLDPAKLEVRRMLEIESLTIGGRRTLFSSAAQRTGKEAAPSPSASLATMTFCTDTDFVVLMHTTKSAELPASAKPTLAGIAESYRHFSKR